MSLKNSAAHKNGFEVLVMSCDKSQSHESKSHSIVMLGVDGCCIPEDVRCVNASVSVRMWIVDTSL